MVSFFVSSVFFSLLQEAIIKATAQKAKVICFIVFFLGREGTNSHGGRQEKSGQNSFQGLINAAVLRELYGLYLHDRGDAGSSFFDNKDVITDK